MEVKLSVFNVGHGAASLLQIEHNDNKFNILIDGGPEKDFVKKLKNCIGTDEALDLVILTHVHTDHSNGLISVFREWKGEIRQLWIPYPVRVLQQLSASLKGSQDEIEDIFNNAEEKNNEEISEYEVIRNLFEEAQNRLQNLDSEDFELINIEHDNDENLNKEIMIILNKFIKKFKNREISELDKDIFHECHNMISQISHTKLPKELDSILDLLHYSLYCINSGLSINIIIKFISIFIAHIIRQDYYNYSDRTGNSLQKRFVFTKSMASYETLNSILHYARTRNHPVPIVHATSDLNLTNPSYFPIKIKTISPTYDLLHEIEANLRVQKGKDFNEYLYKYSLLEAANVVGVATKIIFDNTSILFPGDSDLQDVNEKEIDSDILMIPHHGGNANKFIRNYEKLLQSSKKNLRIIVIPKGQRGDRPNDEWRRIFVENSRFLEVYCTNSSNEINPCNNCNPKNWQTSTYDALQFSYKNDHWEFTDNKIHQLNQRCLFF